MSASGAGVYAKGLEYGVSAYSPGSDGYGKAVFFAQAPNGTTLFKGYGINLGGNVGTSTFVVDDEANVFATGQFNHETSCATGCDAKHKVSSYAATVATPTLEDTGEAQLARGVAYVHLDSAFANAIDPRKGYFVLITPEVETRGLYVAQRTMAGFAVRENLGGRSSGPFAFRVIAHPFGDSAARLPRVDVSHPHTTSGVSMR